MNSTENLFMNAYSVVILKAILGECVVPCDTMCNCCCSMSMRKLPRELPVVWAFVGVPPGGCVVPFVPQLLVDFVCISLAKEQGMLESSISVRASCW